MTSKTLRLSDGSTVRVLEAGAGEPLLLIHGVGLRAEAWGPQMRLEAHVFAVDMPGHGDSTPLPAGARLPEEQADIRARVAGWLQSVSQTGYAMAYRAFAEGDTVYADRISEIACPTLVLTADGDANSTPAMTYAMAGMVQHGQAVVIQGHRHMVNLTAPRAVSDALRAWLAEEVRR